MKQLMGSWSFFLFLKVLIRHFDFISQLYCFLFNPHQGYVFIAFRERERERETNINAREKHRSVASHTHLDWGLNMEPRYVSWPGIEPATLWLQDNTPTNRATPDSVWIYYSWPEMTSCRSIPDLTNLAVPFYPGQLCSITAGGGHT